VRAHTLYPMTYWPNLMAQKTANTSDEGAGLQKANPTGIYKGTREEWLEAAMTIMAVWLNSCLTTVTMKHPTIKGKMVTMARYFKTIFQSVLPKFRLNEVRVSCSLQAAGIVKSNALAHVHLKHSTGNKKHEIRMGVQLGGRRTKEQSIHVADVLLHEMIHCVFPFAGHRGGFYHLAKAVGLMAPMTSTTPSDALKQRIKLEVVDVLGKYPHEKVELIARGKRGKGSRLVLCECPECGCKVRLSRMWIDLAYESDQGCVSCPIGCSTPMEVN